MEPSTTSLPLQETGGCGCDCGTTADVSRSAEDTNPEGTAMTTQTYAVTGLTCGHCEQAVTNELKALDVVTDVSVDLVAGGTSSVTVTSAEPLTDAQVTDALDEAGNYQLV